MNAYFNCHTDITIPYNELGDIIVHTNNGTSVKIIENGPVFSVINIGRRCDILYLRPIWYAVVLVPIANSPIGSVLCW